MNELNSLRALIERIPTAPGSAKVTEILSSLEKEAIGIADLAKTPDPMKSAAANTLVINQQKNRLRDMVATSRNQLTEITLKAKAAFDANRIEKSRLQPSEHAAEIRSIFRELSEADKSKFMLDATKAGDAASVAAIVTVPTVLTGLSAERVAHYKEYFLDSMVPGSKAERQTAGELQSIVDTAITVIDQMAHPVS